jgi:lysozyme family protein
MMMMTPRQFFSTKLLSIEGGYSGDPDDSGNYLNGRLIGSKFGISASALAAHRGYRTLTVEDMKNLTAAEALDIAMTDYFSAIGFFRLDWNIVTCSVVDMGFNAGPKMAAMMLQRLIHVADDGLVGDFTARAYHQWIASHGIADCAKRWRLERQAYYALVVQRRPNQAKFLDGWNARAALFTQTGFLKEFNQQGVTNV